MKRGSYRHPKMIALARTLEIPLYSATGLVECLLQFTQLYAPRGDIGRFGDNVLAEEVGWQGEESAMVAGLVKAGWLDSCACHRLRIHDWPEHCDQTVRRRQEVKTAGFLECYQNASSVLARCLQDASQPSPSPSPSPCATDSSSELLTPLKDDTSSCEKSARKRAASPPGEDAVAFARDFLTACTKVHEGFKQPSPSAFARWEREADRMFRLDRRPVDEARSLARWLFDLARANPDAEFWRANVLSVTKFRAKYDQLRAHQKRTDRGEQRDGRGGGVAKSVAAVRAILERRE